MATGRSLASQFQGLTLDNVGTWPAAPRIVMWLFLIALCAVGGWFGLWSGQKEQLEQLQAEELKLKDEYRGKLQQAINLDELRKQREQVSQYVLTLEKQLPSKSEMDALLSDINQAGVGRGLDFELFRPGQTNVREYYAELPIAVKVSGKYHDLGAFASDIANLPRIVTLNNLNVQSGKGGNLTFDATAKTYRYLDAEEIAAQRAAKAKLEKKGAPTKGAGK
jgi:type IV pilus assembly protein PilO